MHLLHLGSHRLDTAQDLILVGDGCDANSCQVTAERGRKKGQRKLRGLEIPFSRMHADTQFESATINTAQQGRCTTMFS